MSKNKNFDSKTFLKEEVFFHTKIFILVGHSCEFKNIGDFKTIEFFDKSIVIYKFKDKISAFTNICSHRGSKIFNKSSGNSTFVCPYHSWAYDSSGTPKFIPYEKEAFNFKKKQKNKLKLEEWILEKCGEFIFLRSKKNNRTLKNYLGKNFSMLSKISNKIEIKIDYQNYIWNSNWKVCLENSIDEYHAIFLHRSTFRDNLKLSPTYRISNNVMHMEMPLSNNYIKKFEKIKVYFNKLKDLYEHTLFFPCSSISTTMENSFYIQNYLPKTEDLTQVTSTVYLPKISKNMNQKSKDFYSESCKRFNKTVFLEDKLICEGIYQNIKNQKFNDYIGKYEYRIKSFREKIKKI